MSHCHGKHKLSSPSSSCYIQWKSTHLTRNGCGFEADGVWHVGLTAPLHISTIRSSVLTLNNNCNTNKVKRTSKNVKSKKYKLGAIAAWVHRFVFNYVAKSIEHINGMIHAMHPPKMIMKVSANICDSKKAETVTGAYYALQLGLPTDRFSHNKLSPSIERF